MTFPETLIDAVRDTKRIADGGGNVRAWLTYVRLLRGRGRAVKGTGQAAVDRFIVEYADARTLFQLYRDIFVGRLYDVALASARPRIVDCGSNIGMSVLFFKSRFPDAQITAFEPHPRAVELLRRNIERNKLRDVTVHERALSERAGTIAFYTNRAPGELNASLVDRDHNTGQITVTADRLSGYIDAEVDLLKLDIEGAEEGVLRDLAESGTLARVQRIICEYHHHLRNNGDDNGLSRTLAILESHGFGYQLSAYSDRLRVPSAYQDVLIYAYRRESQTGLNIL